MIYNINMKIQNDNNQIDVIIDEGSTVAAVLIPIVEIDGEQHILFEVRSNKLPDQPGDVCLPGGIIENGETALEAVIRETCEELCINENQIEDIQSAKIFHMPSLCMIPFVAKIKAYDFSFSKDEVGEVFIVPLSFFKNNEPEKHIVEWKRAPGEDFPYDKIVGGKNYRWRKQSQVEIFYEYSGHVIWGSTAKIIYYNLAK